METMPDFALPNSAELDPVVTEASSKRVGADVDLATPSDADEGVAAVAGLDRYPVNVGGGLVVAAATDGESSRRCPR